MKQPAQYLTFASRQAWRAWLENNHATADEAWLLHYKKKAANRSVSLDEAVEEALCFGWIDGLLRRVDDQTFALRYSPRKSRSIWAESNKQRVERLIREGRMTAAGLAKVAEAKANGEWEAASARERVDEIPADLEQALKEQKPAWDAYRRWPASKKKQYLYWLSTAKKAGTRQKRIQAIVETASTASGEDGRTVKQ